MLTLERTTWLGPATVLQAGGGRIKLELPDEHAWAVSALAYPYEPAVGDVVLAAGGGPAGQWYVIGVLAGRGQTTLTVPGDLTIAAPAGRIALRSRDGIELSGDEVKVKANRLEILARSLCERFVEATRWVRKTLTVKAGRQRTRVTGVHDLKAGRIVERAKKDVVIDGEQIHLG